jgi:HSP20 family protein
MEVDAMLSRRGTPERGGWQSPFGDLDRVRRDVLQLYDAFSRDPFPDLPAGVFPPMNVTQDEENFYVRAQLPGIKVDELSITSDRNRISISGKRTIPDERDRVSYHRREREDGLFNRSVSVTAPFDTAKVEARYRDGMLTIVLPKAEEAKPRQIPVKTS